MTGARSSAPAVSQTPPRCPRTKRSPRPMRIRFGPLFEPAPRDGKSCRYSASDMTAAATPPTPLKMATICGMPVIGTLRAAGTATSAPEAHARAYYPVMARVLCQKGKSNRDDHARDADQVAIASSARRAERLQGQDEANGRQQVYAPSAIGADMDSCRHGVSALLALSEGSGAFLCCRLLNMSSIRSVTTTPPTMFSVARNTATKARAN